MPLKIPSSEKRTFEQIQEHYEIEKELANRLRNSNKEDRRHLYSTLYDELYLRVPHHPRLTLKTNVQDQRRRVDEQFRLIIQALKTRKSLSLDGQITFLEIGPGDCGLSFEVAKFTRSVYAIDVSEVATRHSKYPENFHLIISDGSSIDVPKHSIHIAYSNQLMEHLHPEDALNQIENIFSALVDEGIYICITPNRYSGPSDISKYFDKVATGFHLKEYTNRDLARIFRQTGFSKVKRLFRVKGNYFFISLFFVTWLEMIVGILPRLLQKKISRWSPVHNLLFIRMIAIK
jgi:SAM-dependent methyltransferase